MYMYDSQTTPLALDGHAADFKTYMTWYDRFI